MFSLRNKRNDYETCPFISLRTSDCSLEILTYDPQNLEDFVRQERVKLHILIIHSNQLARLWLPACIKLIMIFFLVSTHSSPPGVSFWPPGFRRLHSLTGSEAVHPSGVSDADSATI